ncbi:MAG: AmmeMemoRadiSam system radical SAM enzyme [Oscillospiraceae bacterium]|jgi:pyruvate formate lyase activating enzyme
MTAAAAETNRVKEGGEGVPLDSRAECRVCFRHCLIPEGGLGACRARTNEGGTVKCASYGIVTSLALDPIEKKPLRRFCPGSMILSAGGYGCNLRCPFCQNHEISMAGPADFPGSRRISPGELADAALSLSDRGNIGIAFTYNEPMIWYEYVRDTAKLVKANGQKVVLVTNGTASKEVLLEILPLIDAMNIDLKGFSGEYYRDFLGGDLEMTKEFIKMAAESGHVEITTLAVPGKNDSVEEMRRLSGWIASLPGGRSIPLHISRYFPRYRLSEPATPVETVMKLCRTARENLEYVYPGNC